MSTYVLRVADSAGDLRGTVERPGRDQRRFRGIGELANIIAEWERESDAQVGYGSGSMSSSDIRET